MINHISISIIILDVLEDNYDIIRNMTYDRRDILKLLEQRFTNGQTDVNMLKDDQSWKTSIPHEKSGPCYTYDPPFESEPGFDISLYLKLKANEFDDDLQIFLHEKNMFFYSTKPEAGVGYINKEIFEKKRNSHPRAIGNT